MTIEGLQNRLQYFDRESSGPDPSWDHEEAHVLEDGIWKDVLQSIADGVCDDPEGWARLALTTRGYGFIRWYA